jgi:hypothetical protein
VPDQRSLFGATLLRVGGTLDRPGVYDVRSGEALVRRVAVNVDPAESDLRVAPPDSAAGRLRAALQAPVRPVEGSGAAEVAETLRTQQAGTEIWNVFLLLALAFLVAEMVVARLWRPEAASA